MKRFLSAATGMVLCLFTPALLSATEHNIVSLSFGLNQIKEENIVPKVHSGLITAISYARIITDNNRLYADASAAGSYSRMRTVYESNDESACITADIQVRCLFPIVQTGSLQAFLGPELNVFTSRAVYPAWDESHFYWATRTGPALSGRLLWQLTPRMACICTASVQLASLVSRPASDRSYKADHFSASQTIASLFSDPQWCFPDKAPAVSLSVALKNNLNEVLSESIFYRYHYTAIEDSSSKPFRQNTHQIGVSLWF